MNTPRVAIVGATGAVGVEILSCLETRNFPLASLKLLASHRSAGKQVAFRGEMLTVQELTADSFGDVDIALFAANVPEGLKIKAAGGIRSFEDAEAFVNLGASRLGTSALVKLMKAEEVKGY